MAFKKGKDKTGGRAKGTPNKLSKSVRDTVLAVFNELQDDPEANLHEWGKNNPTAFYQIAAKLIPTDLKATVETSETIIHVGYGKRED